jgi:uncharacterized protein (TIGR00251 family)
LTTDLDACARADGGDLYVAVRVQARAKRNEITGVKNGRLQIRTTAPPADGKANIAVTRLLAEILSIAPSRIELRRGKTHRDKQFRVRGLLQA